MLYLIVQNIERNQNEDPDFYNMDAISPLPTSWTSEDNKSFSIIHRVAQQIRPQMMSNDENIDITSKSIHCAKFKDDLCKLGGFPYRLYLILINAECMNYSDIVSFLPHGRAFVICNRVKFEEMVIPKFFSYKSFRSFQR